MKNDLDFAIYLITAADISHVNEVEGVMPICNLILQNQAFTREPMSNEFEKIFNNANSSKMINSCIDNAESINKREEAKKEWYNSTKTVKEKLKRRMEKISYCNQAVNVFDPATEFELTDAFSFMNEKFQTSFSINNCTWKDLEKKVKYLLIFCKNIREKKGITWKFLNVEVKIVKYVNQLECPI